MKAKLTFSDGTVLELEGTLEEILTILPMPAQMVDYAWTLDSNMDLILK